MLPQQPADPVQGANARQAKLNILVDYEGFVDEEDFCEYFVIENIVPAICMNPGCDYTTEYEPDSEEGWCEICGTGSCESGLSLAGLI
jgi:hypothetical protein